MKLKKILWLILVCLILLLLFKPKKEVEILADGIYENCYLISMTEEKMTVLVDGEKLDIPCPMREQEEKRDKIVDLQIENNIVKKIVWKEGLVTDKVDAVNLTEGWLSLNIHGKKQISSKGKLYIKTGEEVRSLSKAGSLLGRENVSLYIYNDEIHAVIVEGDADLNHIRVLLHGDLEGIYHEEISLTGTDAFTVAIDGEKVKYPAGKKVTFSKDMGQAEAVCTNGKIRILSIERAYGNPEYSGSILIHAYEEGFVVKNEVELEEYLYSVVSSEMPASYPEEALKAQAVCARTYAVYQMQQAYYGAYGAHVDDSVNSQVYNNVKETDSTKKAVTGTKGQYLSYEGAPICAYFYSTSCGTTSDVKDVWITEGDTPVYLAGRIQKKQENEAGKKELFSTEEEFHQFITGDGEGSFEKEEPWFRWNGIVSYESLTGHIENNLKNWEKENPDYYKLNSDTDSLGNVIKVQVENRSGGGVIKNLSITGEYGVLTVTGEYQIRKVLCPKGTELILKDGSKRTCNMLPSGYFTVENKEEIMLRGGGYGHGVGLSQNGAKAMAELTYSYDEILDFYYPGTILSEAY